MNSASLSLMLILAIVILASMHVVNGRILMIVGDSALQALCEAEGKRKVCVLGAILFSRGLSLLALLFPALDASTDALGLK